MESKLTYAIGDVHGRADLLQSLLGYCVVDAQSLGQEPRFIFIGDICDKGPESAACYDLVAEALCAFPGSILLRGNHDDLFERSVGRHQERAIDLWLSRGGVQTLSSYKRGDLEAAILFAGAMHADHVRMVADSAMMVVEDGFIFSHAGINPEKPLAEQTDKDVMWLREPFMGHVGDLGRIVVHGHTIVGDLPVVTENRISIDTGAYASGRLTAVRIVGNDVAFFQTDGDAASIVEVSPVLLDRGLGTVMDHTNYKHEERIAA